MVDLPKFGFLLFEGAEELDFVGPWEMATMWHAYASGPHCLMVAREMRPLLCAKATMPKMMPSSEPAGPNTKQMKYSGSAISELTSDPIAMPSLDLGAGYDEYSGGGR